VGPLGTGEVKRDYIPYRVIVPARVGDVPAAGRSFSSDMYANNAGNLIPRGQNNEKQIAVHKKYR